MSTDFELAPFTFVLVWDFRKASYVFRLLSGSSRFQSLLLINLHKVYDLLWRVSLGLKTEGQN